MNNDHIKELARSRAREILTKNNSFRHMPVEDQKKMYVQVVDEQMQQLMSENGGEYSMEKRVPWQNQNNRGGRTADRRRGRGGNSNERVAWQDNAGDGISDERHDKATDFGNAGDALRDIQDAVNFPKFVRDLLKSVFDANIDVMNAQTEDYIKLMKAATTDLAKFIKDIDNTTAFAYLAENNPDEFNLSFGDEDDDEENEEGQEKEEGGGAKLTNKRGEPIDIGDNQVKARIMDAKIKMAQEHRAALREMILMGVTRLVVDKGEVEAEVLFDFHGKRKVDKRDKAGLQTVKRKIDTQRVGGMFGIGGRRMYTGGDRQTQLSVSSAKSSIDDELKTKLRGFVNIKFKTDYFKLDNFAQMYAQPTPEHIKAANPQQGS